MTLMRSRPVTRTQVVCSIRVTTVCPGFSGFYLSWFLLLPSVLVSTGFYVLVSSVHATLIRGNFVRPRKGSSVAPNIRSVVKKQVQWI
jgi:hypothetical protein